MNILRRFSRYYTPPGTGLVPDPRPTAERQRDWEGREVLAAAAPYQWAEKGPSQWRKFPIFDQDGSGSCVSQTFAKILGVENFLEEGKFVRYSARDIYSQRSNFPGFGMWAQNGAEIAHKKGATIEQLMPSELRNEQQMNDASDRRTIDQQVALVGKGGSYLSVPLADFEAVAQVVATGKAVSLGVNLGAGDWATGEVRTRPDGATGHLVAIVDACLWKGRRALVFDNSWGTGWGFGGQGVLTEDNAQGIHVVGYYFEHLKNTWRDDPMPIVKPIHRFDQDLSFGMQNQEVAALQDCLKYEELFPTNTASTGYYGNITAKAVMGFQTKHAVDSPETIQQLQGRKVGPKTRAKLNEIYAQ